MKNLVKIVILLVITVALGSVIYYLNRPDKEVIIKVKASKSASFVKPVQTSKSAFI